MGTLKTKAQLVAAFEDGDTLTGSNLDDLITSLVLQTTDQNTTKLDTINEVTSGNGVAIDSVRMKDGSIIMVNTAGEPTPSAGNSTLFVDILSTNPTNELYLMNSSGTQFRVRQPYALQLREASVSNIEYVIGTISTASTIRLIRAAVTSAGTDSCDIQFKYYANGSGSSTAINTSAQTITGGGASFASSDITVNTAAIPAGALIVCIVTNQSGTPDICATMELYSD